MKSETNKQMIDCLIMSADNINVTFSYFFLAPTGALEEGILCVRAVNHSLISADHPLLCADHPLANGTLLTWCS